jgi:hypothetical protein
MGDFDVDFAQEFLLEELDFSGSGKVEKLHEPRHALLGIAPLEDPGEGDDSVAVHQGEEFAEEVQGPQAKRFFLHAEGLFLGGAAGGPGGFGHGREESPA